jgi:hypothetical protein
VANDIVEIKQRPYKFRSICRTKSTVQRNYICCDRVVHSAVNTHKLCTNRDWRFHLIVQPTLQVQHDIQCFPCSCNFNNNIIMSFKLVTSFQTDCLNRNLCCNLVLILRCFVTICGESEIYCFSIAVSEKRNYCLNFRNVSCSLTLRWRREFFFFCN